MIEKINGDTLTNDMNEALILNLFLYFDLSIFGGSRSDPYDFGEIMQYLQENIKDYVANQKDNTLPEYLAVIEAYSRTHPEISDYVITNVSVSDPKYSGIRGLNAVAFSRTGKDGIRRITVAFRGTAAGEWYDNGQGLGGIEVGPDKGSLQQQEAVRYFEDTCRELKIRRKDYLTLTGHSKGGNKVQYILMISLYADSAKAVYSFGGQGFSPEAVAHFKGKLGETFVEKVKKIFNISAANDYVNVLGDSIIPRENNYYIKTDCIWLYQNHYPNAILKKDGSFKALKKNPHEPGFWGQTVKNASDKIMRLPASERNEITIGIMTIAQRVLGRGAPVNKEKMNPLLMFTAAIKSIGYLATAAFETLTRRIFKQPRAPSEVSQQVTHER